MVYKENKHWGIPDDAVKPANQRLKKDGLTSFSAKNVIQNLKATV